MKRRSLLLIAFAAVAALALQVSPARAELRIDITRGTFEPLPIAITDFHSEDAESARLGADIADVVTADLERSGLFRPLDPQAFIQDAASVATAPRFGEWSVLKAQALVAGTAQMQSDGRLRIEFRLWDVFAQQQMLGLAYATTPNNWRRIGHIIADAVYKRLTGEEGYFDTRIVYIAESGPQNRRVKRLAIMDQDGANHRFLTDGADLVLTPRFSPSTQEITYVSYVNGTPRVYLFNLNTGQQEVLGEFPGMSFAPRFGPGGNSIVMSLARSGNSDVYTLDLRTRDLRRLTADPSIDISPSYSPDGRQIVFNSDRGGSQQLYVMNADGSNVRRISFGDGRYATPVWSPRGDLIAFTRLYQGQFYIGVMRPDGSGERMLVNDFRVEAPTWAPNGRVLAYFRQGRANNRGEVSSKIYTIDLTGFNERQLPTPIDASDPAWSPLIP